MFTKVSSYWIPPPLNQILKSPTNITFLLTESSIMPFRISEKLSREALVEKTQEVYMYIDHIRSLCIQCPKHSIDYKAA